MLPATWPTELEAWRSAQQRPDSRASATARFQGLWTALEDTAIIPVSMPFVRVFARSDGPPREPAELPGTSFLLVSLDLQQIRARVLPQLVARYFSSEDIFDYRVQVAPRRDPGRTIFASDPAAQATRHAAPPDAVVPLFAVRLGEFSALFVPHVEELKAGSWQRAAGSSEQAAGSRQLADSQAQAGGGSELAAGSRQLADSQAQAGGSSQRAAGSQPQAAGSASSRTAEALPGTGATPTAVPPASPRVEGDRFAVSVIRLRSAGAEAVAMDASGGRWQLRLAHRAGSVDAAVARTRNRNLLLSSTVLLLLAAASA